ncbi:ExbD/TolR family protein [Crateriforma spongiae]|nr:biopolymer transporter ExbD [Crateriforma spongiae]
MTQHLSDQDDSIHLPRHKRAEDEMDITPMIDITFLLLIFFVVASKMDPTQTGTIPSADNGLAVSADDSAVLFLEPGPEDKAIVTRLDGTPFSMDEEVQAAEIVEYVDTELNRTVGRQKTHVMLMGDADLSVMHVTRVQRIIGDAFEDLDVTYIAVKEQ